MVCASSGRLDHIQSWSGVKVNTGEKRKSGLPRALRIVLDVAPSLRMSAGAMLLRTGNQSVLVHRAAPVVVIMVLFSCTSTRLVCAEFPQTVAQYSATE